MISSFVSNFLRPIQNRVLATVGSGANRSLQYGLVTNEMVAAIGAEKINIPRNAFMNIGASGSLPPGTTRTIEQAVNQIENFLERLVELNQLRI
jgi:hypothetical protein